MARKMKTEAELIAKATSIVREYIKAMSRLEPELGTFRVKDIRRRLMNSGYECYVNATIIELAKEGFIKTVPETMDSLVYLVRHDD